MPDTTAGSVADEHTREIELQRLQAFFGFCRTSDLDGLRGFAASDAGQSSIFREIFALAADLGSEDFSFEGRNVQSLPDYDRSWMPGNMRGLDTFKRMVAPRGAEDSRSPSAAAPLFEVFTDFECPISKAVTVSSDSTYFEWFFDAFYQSFVAHRAEGDGMNLCLVNPSEDVLRSVRQLKGDARLRIVLNHEPNPVPAYYACSRYFAALELLEWHEISGVVIDFDAVLVGGIGAHTRSGDFQTVAGRMNPRPRLPWMQYLASYADYPANEIGIGFLSEFRDATLPLLRDKSLEHWYIDQAALFTLFGTGRYGLDNRGKRSGNLYRQADHLKAEKNSLR